MCGLVGMVGNIDANLKKLFNDLLMLDSIRGPHSTGVLTVDRFTEQKTQIVKVVGDGFDMMGSKAYDQMMTYSKAVLLGHNRWATKGKINKINAHPFEHGHIIGAHNGTLSQQSLLKDHQYFDVDSENIFYHMAHNGVDDTIKNLNGSYALTWYDMNDKTVNFCRNAARPLMACYTKDRKTLIWASESWMILAAAHRQKIDITDVFEIETGKHYKVKIPGLGTNAAIGNYPAFTIEDMEIREVETYRNVFTTKGTQSGGKTSSTSATQTTTSHSSVGKYTGLPSSGKACADYSTYAEYIGKKVEFVVQGTALDDGGNMYLDCVGVDDESIQIRVYADYKSELWDELAASCEAWQGLAKRFSPIGDGYLLIDLRTLLELPGLLDELEELERHEPKFKVWGGRIVDLTEYNHLVRNGCCWCAQDVGPGDSNDILWVSADDFVCGCCKNNADVMQYYRYVE